MSLQEYINIDKNALLNEVQKMKHEGYRLAQICATKLDQFILLYSFVKDEQLVNFRIILDLSEEIESIGCLYPYAFLYENEMKDLFGVKISDMAIDFKGYLYKTSIKTPFNPEGNEVKDNG